MKKSVFKSKKLLVVLLLITVIAATVAVFTSAQESSVPGFTFKAYNDTITISNVEYGYPDATYVIQKRLEKVPQTVSAWVYVPSVVTSSEVGAIIGNTEGRLAESGIDFKIGVGAVPTISIQNKYKGINAKGGNNFHYDVKFEKSAVPTDVWSYVTFVYDSESGVASCYVNGALGESKYFYPEIDDEILVNTFVFGGDNRELNHGYFKGGLGDLTVYSDARSAAEIKADYEKGLEMTKESLDKNDVILYYDIDENDVEKNITDDSGNGYDVLYEKMWITEDEMAKMRNSYGFVPSYSFAVVGDTQKATRFYPQNLPYIYDYIVKNENIKFSIGLGDITDKNGTAEGGSFVFVKNESEPGGGHYERNSSGTATEWDVVKHAISIMDGKVDYSLIEGNHDGSNTFNAAFNNSEFTYASQILNNGGMYNGSINNAWRTFSVGNVKYLIMNIGYRADSNVIAWANEVLGSEENEDYNVIITTHAYLDCDGTALDSGDINCGTTNSGVYLWENLVSKHANVKLMLSGHVDVDKIVYSQRQGVKGNTVTEILVNPQSLDRDAKAPGMVAMFNFSEDGQKLAIEFYSTVRGVYLKNPKVINLAADAQVIEEDSGWMGNSIAPSGSGTESDPYKIENGGNLLWMAEQVKKSSSAAFGGKYFEQTSDIDLNGNSIYSIGYYFGGQSDMAAFGGHYDGNGYSIKNGSIHPFSRSNESSVAYGYGLFGVIFGATVEDVVLDEVEVIGVGLTGGIVGRAASPVVTDANFAGFNIISGCEIKNTVKFVLGDITPLSNMSVDNASRGGRFGSICGMAHNTVIEGCISGASIIFGGDYGIGGGIAGTAGLNTVIDNCAFTGAMTLCDNAATAESYYGGIVGAASPSDKTTDTLGNAASEHGNLTVTNCYSTGVYHYTGTGEASEVTFNGVIAYSTLAADNVYTSANCLTEQNSEIDSAIAVIRSSEVSAIWQSGTGKPTFKPATVGAKYYDQDSGFYYTYDGESWQCANGIEIENYGTVPSAYANEKVYPFLIFLNGEFKTGASVWNTTQTDGVIAEAVKLATNKDDVVTVLLRDDYTHTASKPPNTYNQLVGTLNVDLGGKTLTAKCEIMQFNHKQAQNTVRVNFFNGYIHTDTRGLVNLMNQSADVRQDLKLSFKDITFIHRKSGWSIIGTSDNKTGLCVSDIVFENCTIDLQTLQTAFPLIKASGDTNKSHVVHTVFKGGEIKSDVDFSGSLMDYNTGYANGEADTLKFERDENNEYTKFIVPSTVNSISGKIYDSKNLTYVSSTADGYTTYQLVENYIDGVGQIAPQYYDVQKYPFLIFKDKVCVGAGDNLNRTNSVISTAIPLATENSAVTVVLRRDFESKVSKIPNTYKDLKGTLNIDLGGYKLTTYTEIIQFNHQALESEINVNIYNGTIEIADRALVNLLNQKSTADAQQNFNLTFRDIKICYKAGTSQFGYLINAIDQAAGLCVTNITFDNCVIDLTNYGGSTKTYNLVVADADTYNSYVIHMVIKGGEYIIDSDATYNLISGRKTGYTDGEADTLKFEKDSNGNYTRFVMPASMSKPTDLYDTENVSYVTIGTDGKNSIYSLEEKENESSEYENTEYGNIPLENANDAIVLFQYGKFVTSYATWNEFIAAMANLSDTSKEADTVILVRKDCTTTGASATLHKVQYLTIDLADAKISGNKGKIFNLSCAGDVDFVANITIKNGTLSSSHVSNPPITFNSSNTTGANAKFIVTFEGVTFAAESTHGGQLVMIPFSNGTGGCVYEMAFNDCTFDATKGSVTGIFGMEDGSGSNKFDVHVTVNGGTLKANKYFDFATFSPEREAGKGSPDTLVFGNDTFTVVLPKDAAAPSASDVYTTVDGVECVLVKVSETGGNANYTLYPKVMAGYKIKTSVTLWSNFVYNVYIPKANVARFNVNGITKANEEIEIDGVLYYLVKVELPASESLSDIAVCVTLNSGDARVDANWTLSVLKYAKSVIGGGYDDTTKNLMRDMLVYASAAHTYFENELDAAKVNTITDLLDGYTRDLPTGNAKAPADKTYFTSATVYLGEVPSFRFYLAGDYTADDFSFKVGNRSVTAKLGNDNDGYGNYLEVVMYAYMMLDDVTYTVTNKDINETVTQSYNLYAYYAYISALAENNPEVTDYINAKALTEALMKYAVSASAYRDSVIAAD